MYDDFDDETPAMRAVGRWIMLPLGLAAQVVTLGGVWAAATGNDFLFWSFDGEKSWSWAAAIVFIGEPIVLTVAYWISMIFALPILWFEARRHG